MTIEGMPAHLSATAEETDTELRLYLDMREHWPGQWYAIVRGQLIHDPERARVAARVADLGFDPEVVLISFMPPTPLRIHVWH